MAHTFLCSPIFARLFLIGSVCDCVCVRERERKRESISGHTRVPSPTTRIYTSLCSFPGYHQHNSIREQSYTFLSSKHLLNTSLKRRQFETKLHFKVPSWICTTPGKSVPSALWVSCWRLPTKLTISMKAEQRILRKAGQLSVHFWNLGNTD